MEANAVNDQEIYFIKGSQHCKWTETLDEGVTNCKATRGASGTCSKRTCPIMLEVVHVGKTRKD